MADVPALGSVSGHNAPRVARLLPHVERIWTIQLTAACEHWRSIITGDETIVEQALSARRESVAHPHQLIDRVWPGSRFDQWIVRLMTRPLREAEREQGFAAQLVEELRRPVFFFAFHSIVNESSQDASVETKVVSGGPQPFVDLRR